MRTLLLLSCALLFSCGKDRPDSPTDQPATQGPQGTRAEAEKIVRAFMASGATVKLLKELRPTSAEYQAAFRGDAADKVQAGHAALWNGLKPGTRPVGPKTGQTEIRLFAAKSEDFVTNTEDSKQFPGGYHQIAEHLQPGVTWYVFKYLKPGEEYGMSFDGLAFVNGRWAFFPKPYRPLG